MQDLELYIKDKKVDLVDDALVLFTFQKTDYTSPTAIKNTFTKTVTLPGTQNNNQVFDSIFRLDRFQTSTLFDPSKRVPFKLFKSGDLIESGYCRLDKINRGHNFISYSLTLYGGLGDFIYGLTYDSEGNKLNLGDLKYFDGDRSISFRITSDAILQAWSRLHNGQLDTDTPEYTDRRLNQSFETDQFDVVNFAPAYNGIPENDNFDPSKVYMLEWYRNPYNKLENGDDNKPAPSDSNGGFYPTIRVEVSGDDNYTYTYDKGWWIFKKKKEATDQITAPYVNVPITGKAPASSTDRPLHLVDYPIDFISGTKSDASTIYKGVTSEKLPYIRGNYPYNEDALTWGVLNLKEDATEWQVRDLRSYMQRPVVRVKKIFEAIQRYAEDVLGYSVDLDPNFFNTENSYYNESWITLPLLNEQEKGVKSGDYIGQKNGESIIEEKRRTFTDISSSIPDIVEEVEYNNVGILDNTDSPADYLTSFAKIFNLHIVCSKTEKRVTIMTRDSFYYKQTTVEDIDETIDRNNMEITPLSFDFKWFKMKYEDGKSVGLSDYQDNYSIEYGARRWNTGYDFESSNKNEPDKIIFKNALDVLEKDTFFSSMWSGGGANEEILPRFNYENNTGIYPACMNGNGMTYSYFAKKNPEDIEGEDDTLYSSEERKLIKIDGQADKFDGDGAALRIGPTFIDGYLNETYSDAFPKPQFHSDKNKAEDGKNVLLFFNKTVEPKCRTYTSKNQDSVTMKRGWFDVPSPYFLTDDIVKVNNDVPVTVNGKFSHFTPGDNGGMKEVIGTRCWVQPQFVKKNYNRTDIIVGTGGDDKDTPLWYGGYTLYYVPMFNRVKLDYDEKKVVKSFDWGTPQALYFPGYSQDVDTTITKQFKWDNYVKDVFSVNTREVKCRMQLEIPDEALRRFYYFDNSYWSLTKIADFDYKNKFCEATFIKVNELSNYSAYLLLSKPVVNFPKDSSTDYLEAIYGGNGEGEITITAPDWVTVGDISTSRGQGEDDYVSRFPISAEENTTGDTRRGNINVSYGNINRSIEVVQTSTNRNPGTYDTITIINNEFNGIISGIADRYKIVYRYTSPTPWIPQNATVDDDWLKVSGIEQTGTNTYTVYVDVDNNYTGDLRNSTVHIIGSEGVSADVVVRQSESSIPPVSDFITITYNNITNPIPYTEATYIVNAGYKGENPEVISSVDWINITPTIGPSTISALILVDENTGDTDREGTITIKAGDATKTITVRQSKYTPVPPEPENHLEITGNNIPDRVPVEGGNYTVSGTYSSPTGSLPVVKNVPSWIHVSPTISGGTFTLDVDVDENTGENGRTGSFTISVGDVSKTITITQNGTVPPGPDEYYTLTINALPDNATITFDGGGENEFTLTVNASPDTATITFDAEPTPPEPGPDYSKYLASWTGGTKASVKFQGDDFTYSLNSPIQKSDYPNMKMNYFHVIADDIEYLDSRYLEDLSLSLETTSVSSNVFDSSTLIKLKKLYLQGDLLSSSKRMTQFPFELFDLSELTSLSLWYVNLTDIPRINAPLEYVMIANCDKLITLPYINITNVGLPRISNCYNLETVPRLDASSAISLDKDGYLFGGCRKLTNLGGLDNLGKSPYLIGDEFDISGFSKLTLTSVENIINGLYDRSSTEYSYYAKPKLIISTTHYNQLSTRLRNLVSSKGWTLIHQ